MPLKEFKAKLIPEIKEITISSSKNLLTSAMSGEIMSYLKGRGIEFEDYRDYTIIDDAARIDWRASKRSQRLLVREYKLEINFNVFLLIDTSESMLFASTNKLKCEYAAQVATSIYHGILASGNSVGFGLFNENMYKIMKPAMNKKQFYMFTKEISKPENYGGEKNIAKTVQQALSILNKKALVFIISDFLSADTDWGDFVKIMANKHEVIGIMIQDPRDMEIPKDAGQIIIEDPYSKDNMYIDAKQYHDVYAEDSLKQRKIIRSMFQHFKSDLLELRTDQPYLNPLLQFLRKRGGRWR